MSTATDLGPLATPSGRFTIAALDHRDALIVELGKAGIEGGPDALVGFKRRMLRALGDRPSAVMLEPEYALPGLAQEVAEGVGITCALEAQGYFANPLNGNRLMEGWRPGLVAEVGAHAAKLLVLYRHDRDEFTTAQEALVSTVVAEAAEASVPVLVEPVPFDVADDDDRAAVIVESARRLTGLGPMLLKMPFPGAGRCSELDEACGANPWALLSWGVAFETYRDQLTEACADGCSGFTAGRALWREALNPVAGEAFMASEMLDRFDELAAIAATGTAWNNR